MSIRMKIFPIFLVLTVLLVGCGIKEFSNATQVVYVGNSGFLISVGDKKVLIDAMIDGFPPDYTLPGEVLSKIQDSQPPFDNVDLILASHEHADHFSATMVRNYLQNNPNTVFISTTQATSHLSDFGNRAIAVDPTEDLPVTVTANDIQVEAIYLSHGEFPAGMQEIYNNAYVVTLNEIKFFHTGDIENLREVIPYDLASQSISLAFVPHFFMQDGGYRDVIQNNINAEYLFPIHYHFTTPVFDANLVKASYPDAVIFNNELETWIMP